MAIQINGTDVIDNSKNVVNVVDGTFSGDVTANNVSGDGSAITSLDADNITSGTISDDRLPDVISSDTTGNAANGGVTQIVAGSNVTISPTNGLGVVTVNSSGGGGGDVEEAPIDGNQYARQDAAWSVVTGGGGSSATIGAIVAWASPIIPAGWLECNGSSIPAEYSELIALIGANTPDLRGEFVRGWDNGRGVDIGRSILSSQEATETRQGMDAFGGSDDTSTGGTRVGQQYRQADSQRIIGSNLTPGELTDGYFGEGLPIPTTGGNNFQDNIIRSALDSGGVEPDENNWISHRPRNVALMFIINANGSSIGAGDGGTTVIQYYNGASSWGSVNGDGSLEAGLNCNVTLNPDTSTYRITFLNPMPSNKYAVTFGSKNTGTQGRLVGQTATYIDVNMYDLVNEVNLQRAFCFAVFATNALPPKGGTGTDAWARFDNGANILSSFNIASVTNSSTGLFDVVFTTPMPTSNYSVVATPTSANRTIRVGTASATGFQIEMRRSDDQSLSDSGVNFAVNATNATLPQTVTQEQIESAINNPGASAWAQVDEDGNVTGAMNISDVTRTAAGKYQYTFVTPMPNANYSVIGSVSGPFSTNGVLSIGGITANGFLVTIKQLSDNSNTDKDHAVTVFATNALPPKGGTGTDAWGEILENGGVSSGFNISNVTKLGTGVYQVNFNTPMPSDSYAVMVTGGFAPNVVGNTSNVSAKTVNSFKVDMVANTGAAIDQRFDFTVHATNATLPDSFSEEQIQSVVDLAQSGATNPGASAWGNISSSGELDNGLNIASVTRTGTGLYDVVFQTPMPNNDYSVVVGGSSNMPRAISQTATGFTVETRNASATIIDSSSSFQVFATNALPPKGGTGTDAWGSWSTDTGDIRSSFNIASITRTDTGQYDVLFTSPMPDGTYSVTTGSQDRGVLVSLTEKSSTGFKINTTQIASTTRVDASFDFQVNATNATLPDSFTKEQIQSVVDLAQSGVIDYNPTGSVTMFAGVTIPDGWLECNGQAAPSALAAVLGQPNVPDLRGEFVRGLDNGRGIDSGRTLLSTQSDEFGSHRHSTYAASRIGATGANSWPAGWSRQDTISTGATFNTNYVGDNETRPRNVALMYIIKT